MQEVLRTEGLPQAALEAAAAFHARYVPQVRAVLAGSAESVALVFPFAPQDHRGWRLAAVQDLARAAAPKRVNGIAGEDEQAVAAALDYLASAPGVTGQLLPVSGNGGQEVS